MTVQEDKSLEPPSNLIERPIIIIHKDDEGRHKYIFYLAELDPTMTIPETYGVLLSDLLDHIAAAYHHQTGRDARDIKEQIALVMQDEDRFKKEDPSRGGLKGHSIMPSKN